LNAFCLMPRLQAVRAKLKSRDTQRMANQAEASPRQRLSQMMCGYWISQAVYVTARLDLVEHLQAGPQTAAQLAPLTGSHAGALYRLLRAMASLGFFREDEQGRFHVLELAEPLSRDAVESQKAWA